MLETIALYKHHCLYLQGITDLNYSSLGQLTDHSLRTSFSSVNSDWLFKRE